MCVVTLILMRTCSLCERVPYANLLANLTSLDYQGRVLEMCSEQFEREKAATVKASAA
jgi:hypothetical protein